MTSARIALNCVYVVSRNTCQRCLSTTPCSRLKLDSSKIQFRVIEISHVLREKYESLARISCAVCLDFHGSDHESSAPSSI